MGRIFAKIGTVRDAQIGSFKAIQGVRVASIRELSAALPVQNLAATVDCFSTATAFLSVAKPLAATAFTTSDSFASLSLLFTVSAIVNANSVVSASLSLDKPLQATAAVTSGATATLISDNTLSATVPAISTVTGNLLVGKQFGAIVAVLSGATVNPVIGKPLQSAASGNSSTSASLTVDKPLAATVAATSSASASLTVTNAQSLSSTATVVSSTTADLSVGKLLQATALADSDTAATLTLGKLLQATSSGNSTATADLTIAKPLAATAICNSSTSADLTVTNAQSLSATATVESTATATLTLVKNLSGSVSANSTTAGDLTIGKPLAATVAVVSGTAANLTAYDSITAAYVARLTGSYTVTQTNKLDTFVRALRTAGIHNQFEFLHLYGWAVNQADSFLNLFDTSNGTTVRTGSVTFNQGVGIVTASDSCLNTNFLLVSGTKYLQDTNTFGVWVPSGRGAASTGHDMSATTGSSFASSVQYRFTGDLHRIRNNDTNLVNSGGLTTAFTACKMIASRRSGSMSIQIIRDGVSVASSSIMSTTRGNLAFYVGALNNSGTASNFASETYGADWAGSAFSDTQYSAFYSAMNALFS